MSLFSVGSRPTKTFQLNDSDGTDKVIVKDSRGFTVAEIDSLGNIKIKGAMKKR